MGVGERILRLFGTIPISLKDRRAAYQDFAVFGDADLEIRQRLAHGPDAMVDRRVYSDHGRGFGKAVSFVNADTDGRVPLRQFTSQGCPTRDEGLDPSAH